METWVRRETMYQGKLVTLCRGSVRLDDGRQALREVVEHPGGVAIVPFSGDTVVFVRQFRVAVGKDMLEVPAGKLEGNEEPEHRARAELEEETGYRAGRLVPAGHFYPSPGFLTEKLHVYLALDLERTAQRLEWDEAIEVVELSIEDVRRRLAAHIFDDAKTIIGLHALLAYTQSR